MALASDGIVSSLLPRIAFILILIFYKRISR
jgi:hypothetical protein